MAEVDSQGCVQTLAASVANLSHLEGQTITVLADGIVLDEQSVVDGKVDFESSFGEVHVGLPYVSDLETLNIEVGLPDGSLRGRKVQIGNVVFRFIDSFGGFVGPNIDCLFDAFDDERVTQNITQLDTSFDLITLPYLYTGDIRVPTGSGYQDGGRVFYRNIDPRPVTISAIMPEIAVGKPTK